MTVKVKRADGFVEVFETDRYTVSTVKELHPAILKAEVFTSNGFRLACIKRRFSFFYKHFVFNESMLKDLDKKEEPKEAE